MKKNDVSIISLLILMGCLGWSLTSAAAIYDPIVEQAQTRLTKLGYELGPIDGLWGKKTETAIRNFQQDQNLQETGKLDEETLQELGISKSEEQSPIVEQPDKQELLQATKQPQEKEQDVTAEQLEALFQKAVEYYNSGNYVQAIEYCTQVIELDSSHVQAYWYRGIAYGEQEEYDLAISDFRKVTELEPDLADGYGMWGGALILQGKFEEAKIPCRKAYTLAPDNIIWTMILGHTYLLTGDRGTARGYYQKAIPLITSQEELQSALALFDVFIEKGWQTEACQQEVALIKQEFSAKQQRQVQELFQQALEYHKAEQYEKAEEYYTMVIDRDPTVSDAYWNRGLIYAEYGLYDLAASDFRKVSELLPDFADAYGNLAWYLFMQDKFEEAKESYHKAIELVPENITWMMNLGHIYLFTNDRTSARTYYQKVLTLLQSEEDFTQATLLLEAFIEADVEAAAFRQELEWMRQEFDKI